MSDDIKGLWRIQGTQRPHWKNQQQIKKDRLKNSSAGSMSICKKCGKPLGAGMATAQKGFILLLILALTAG